MKKVVEERDPFVELADIEPKKVKWLFEPFIPFSMISILEGDPGLGKSFLAMHIAALVSAGGRWPSGQKVKAANVLYLSAEDDNEYTIRPRMEAMGADLSRVVVLEEFISLDVDGLAAVQREIEKNPPALIVLDPMIAFMEAGGDPYRPTTIRPFLGALRKLAEATGAAVLIIRHLAKARYGNALYQGAGSIDQVAAARSVMRVAPNPDDADQRVLAHVKHNLSARGTSFLFEVRATEGDGALVKWHGETHLTIDDLDGGGAEDDSSALEAAESFLRNSLEDGAVLSTTLFNNAESRGLAKRTLERAKKKLGVVSKKKGDGWYWAMPA